MSKEHATGQRIKYSEKTGNIFVEPECNDNYRLVLGCLENSKNPLFIICMNPSSADKDMADRTINRIIYIKNKLGYDGWVVFNLYPERATKPSDLKGKNKKYDPDLARENLDTIKKYINKYNVEEVMGAWGNINGCEILNNGKKDVLELLNDLDIKVFCYGETKQGEPRHPMQRFISPDDLYKKENRHYYENRRN